MRKYECSCSLCPEIHIIFGKTLQFLYGREKRQREQIRHKFGWLRAQRKCFR